MAWYAISTYPGQEQRLCDAMKAEMPEDKPDMFRFFTLPVRRIWIHDDKDKEKRNIALVFVETDDVNNIRKIRDGIRLREHLHMTLMYDVILQQPLIIPESQMQMFQRQNPDFIEELVILSQPFAGYAKKNVRFLVLDGPFAGQEGYKIDLHREKKLALSFGGMALTVNKLYQYKIVRVIETSKELMFRNQQLLRMVSSIIGSLQVHGFADTAYPTLNLLLELCHEAGDSVKGIMDSLPSDNVHLKKYIKSLDAFTAGHIQSLSVGIHQPDANKAAFEDALTPRTMLTFLTPTSGRMNADVTHDITVEHEGFREVIHRIMIQERVPDNSIKKSKNKKTEYFGHFKVEKVQSDDSADVKTVVSADFSAFFRYYSSLMALQRAQELIRLEKAESPLYPLLSSDDSLAVTIDSAEPSKTELSDAIKSLSQTAASIIEHLLHTPRLAQWRNLLPEVMIHQ